MAASPLSGKGSLTVLLTSIHSFCSFRAVSWKFGTQPLANLNKSSEAIPCGVFGRETITWLRTLTSLCPVKTSVSSVSATLQRDWMSWPCNVYSHSCHQNSHPLLSKHSFPLPRPSPQTPGSNSRIFQCFRIALSCCCFRLVSL